VHTVVLRLWLPDRPGALGQVASRIGAVRGDLLGIEILEAGAGSVIDELVVRLPDAGLVDLMITEVDAVDGVGVEHVRSLDGGHVDPDLAALTLVAEIAELDDPYRPAALARGTRRLVGGDWAALLDGVALVAVDGEHPDLALVAAAQEGSGHLGESAPLAGELFWARVAGTTLVLAAGREGLPIHTRERARIELLARISRSLLAAGRR
jgi:hypothetical protein